MSLLVAYTVFFGLVTVYGSSEVKRHREKMRRE
jgi:hypothetical protein